MAWIVTVDLERVGRRLSKQTSHHHDEFDVVAHLTGAHRGAGAKKADVISSPFKQTMEWGLFYIDECDPALLLEDGEFIAQACAETKHFQYITKTNHSPQRRPRSE